MKSASTTVKKEELNQILEQWLKDGDLPATTTLQLYFLPGEIIIRPSSPEEQELTEWFDSFRQRYDETLEKLAEGPES